MQDCDYIQFSFNVPSYLTQTIAECLGDETEAFWLEDLRACGILHQNKQAMLEQILERLSLIPEFTKIENRDWLNENQNALQPIEIKPFFIHAPHFQGDLPIDRKTICIDSPYVFGSGHHPTTASCLEMLIDLSVQLEPNSVLDLGCGSGLLSIAAALLWQKSQVYAVDCDPESVIAAQKNCVQNSVGSVSVLKSNGFNHPDLKTKAPFDLIVSNIHSNSLISFADDLQNFLIPDGWLILSGILQTQKNRILEAYLPKGFVFAKVFTSGDWVTLAFQKN